MSLIAVTAQSNKGGSMSNLFGSARLYVIALFIGQLLATTVYAEGRWIKLAPFPEPSEELLGAAAGGFVPPEAGEPAWVPINNAWEYDPVADTWKALAPMPTKRGSPVVAAVGNKIYVIGGATTPAHSNETAVHPARPHLAVGTVEEYDPATNTWRERTPMPTARNHAVTGAVNGKIYVIGGRVGAAFIGVASNTNVVEEYDPAADAWRP